MEQIVNSNGLMDVKGAAEYLGIKVSTLYQLTMRKKISVVKIGRLNRFRKVDLDTFINSCIVDKNEG